MSDDRKVPKRCYDPACSVCTEMRRQDAQRPAEATPVQAAKRLLQILDGEVNPRIIDAVHAFEMAIRASCRATGSGQRCHRCGGEYACRDCNQAAPCARPANSTAISEGSEPREVVTFCGVYENGEHGGRRCMRDRGHEGEHTRWASINDHCDRMMRATSDAQPDPGVVTLMRDMYERTCVLLDGAGFTDLAGQCVQTSEDRVRGLIASRSQAYEDGQRDGHRVAQDRDGFAGAEAPYRIEDEPVTLGGEPRFDASKMGDAVARAKTVLASGEAPPSFGQPGYAAWKRRERDQTSGREVGEQPSARQPPLTDTTPAGGPEEAGTTFADGLRRAERIVRDEAGRILRTTQWDSTPTTDLLFTIADRLSDAAAASHARDDGGTGEQAAKEERSSLRGAPARDALSTVEGGTSEAAAGAGIGGGAVHVVRSGADAHAPAPAEVTPNASVARSWECPKCHRINPGGEDCESVGCNYYLGERADLSSSKADLERVELLALRELACLAGIVLDVWGDDEDEREVAVQFDRMRVAYRAVLKTQANQFDQAAEASK